MMVFLFCIPADRSGLDEVKVEWCWLIWLGFWFKLDLGYTALGCDTPAPEVIPELEWAL